MVGLADELDTVIAEAVKGLRNNSYSCAEISARRRQPPSGTATLGTQMSWPCERQGG